MDWEPTQTTTVATIRRLQSSQKRAKWVSHEEIGRRMKDGSCIRCGNDGHMIRDCSFLPAQNPKRQANKPSDQHLVASAKPAVVRTPQNSNKEPTIEEAEDWETDNESGKE